jgi:hypothetical protein
MLDAQCSDQGREGRIIRMLQNYRDTPAIGTTRGLCIDGDHALVVTDLYNQPIGTVISLKICNLTRAGLICCFRFLAITKEESKFST